MLFQFHVNNIDYIFSEQEEIKLERIAWDNVDEEISLKPTAVMVDETKKHKVVTF